MSKDKILIIGSEGFIGRYMVRDLKAEGFHVSGFDIAPEDAGRSGYTFYKGSILSKEQLRVAMKGADMVINLAAKHHDFGVSKEDFFLINETGTQIMLDVMDELQIKRLVFYSSVAVYGETSDFSHEGMGEHPVNDYGRSKLAGEALIRAWAARDSACEVLVVRPVVVFGPYNFANMFRLIDNIYHNRFVLVGSGENVKSVCYVENLVSATVFMIKKMRPGAEVVNYSDQPHKTSREITNLIRAELGMRPLRFHLPLNLICALAFPIDIAARITNINFPITASRIRKFASSTLHGSEKVRGLGFQQRYSVEEGLKNMVMWYVEQGRGRRDQSAAGPRA